MRENRIEFTIPMEPRGQMRTKSRAMRLGNDKIVSQVYKQGKQRTEEEKIIAFAAQHRPSEPIKKPLWLGVKAYFAIPESKPRKWKQAALDRRILPDKKPDMSNVVKMVEDCMNGIFWDDDKRIVGYLEGTGKYYSDRPRWEITVEW